MKLTNTQTMKRKSGMTLLELTVVILVLLSLISILFIGARAWKKGSDRSANIMNIRNTQQAMRGEENMKTLNVGDPFLQADLERYMTFPRAIAGGDVNGGVSYAAGAAITAQSATPAAGTAHLWIVPTALGLPGAEYGHVSVTEITGW